MSIDWLTVAAQVVNFLVLLALLKHFLYRPILDGIDAREREIAERLAEAVRAREAAERAEGDYRARSEDVRREREGVLEAARQSAEAAREALLGDARERLEREREAAAAARAEEARRYGIALHRVGAEALLSLTRKALADLADETLEQRVVAHLGERARALADELRRTAGESRDAVASTREALPDASREAFERALAGALPGVTLRYRRDPEQAPGLILRLGGARLSWTLDSYVDALEAKVREGLAAGVAGARGGRADAA